MNNLNKIKKHPDYLKLEWHAFLEELEMQIEKVALSESNRFNDVYFEKFLNLMEELDIEHSKRYSSYNDNDVPKNSILWLKSNPLENVLEMLPAYFKFRRKARRPI